ncbi:MAG: Get4 family protein [archaeon]|nr:Get4 family protein [archaeon]
MEEDNQLVENFKSKFERFLTPSESYQFLLKMQFLIPKLSKLEEKKFYPLVKFGLNHLSNLNEANSCLSLLEMSFDNFVKNNKISTNEYFLEKWKELFLIVPTKVDKSNFKVNFLQYCNKNKIEPVMLNKYQIYEIFAYDSLGNAFYVQNYRFSIKAENLDLILNATQHILNHEIKMIEEEKSYFIGRTCLEILLLKNVKLAYDFISYFVEPKSENNHPIINLVYSMTCLLLKMEGGEEKTLDNIKDILKQYKTAYEKQKDYSVYINQISMFFFEEKAIKDNKGFSLLNMLRAFAV